MPFSISFICCCLPLLLLRNKPFSSSVISFRNAQNIANQGDDANAAANPAAAANNVQNEANIVDNPPSLNNRIQRVRLMICLAKAIKNCRPWMDLGLFWMQILSMVGRHDPLMIINRDEYETLYNTQNEMSNHLYLRNAQNNQLDSNIFLLKHPFHGCRYMTLNEYKMYCIRKEITDEAQQAVDQALNNNGNNNNNMNVSNMLHLDDSDEDDDDDKDDEKRAADEDDDDNASIDDNGSSDAQESDDQSLIGEASQQQGNLTTTAAQTGNGAVYVGINTTSSTTTSSSSGKKPTKSRKKKKKKKKSRGQSILDRVDIDFELAHDHEWMRSSLVDSDSKSKPSKKGRRKRRKESLEMDTFHSNIARNTHSKPSVYHADSADNDAPPEDDGFYPKSYPINVRSRHLDRDDDYYDDEENGLGDGISDGGDIDGDMNPLFAFNKLRVEKLRNFFQLEFDKALPPSLQVAQCRYFGRFQGGCWGRVIGRIVYSNSDYQQGGNYPCEVLFSCEAHSNEDFTDELLDRCQSCERLFRKGSMMPNALICKTCFDSKKLQQKCIWVNLNKKGLKNFNFAHVCQYTLNVADRRNLPKSLKSYGKIKAQLTYEISPNQQHQQPQPQAEDEENGLLRRRRRGRQQQMNDIENGMNDEEEEEEKVADEAVMDLSRVSINTFWENNEARISAMMDKFQEALKTAQSRCATRAILVYYDGKDKTRERERGQRLRNGQQPQNADDDNKENNNNDNDVEIEEEEEDDRNTKYIEVLADPGVLFDGLDGVDYIFLTVSAWTQFYSILCPILFSILCSLYFLYELNTYNYNAINNARTASAESTNAIYLPDAPSAESSTSKYLFYALGAFITLITGAFIAYKFQRRCEQVFRMFLVVDIFLILFIGCAILFVIVGYNYNVTLDMISFLLIVYNFGVIGVMSFYCSVPPLLHRAFLVILNCIMAIMITSAINWYVLFLLLILICADIIAMIKPSFGRMFSPFLVPTQIQLPNTTPRIFYQVYGLRVRAPEFMFYGLMLGLIEKSSESTPNTYYSQAIMLLITIVSGFVISVFVMPFFSKQIRPLPVSFILLVVALIFYQQIFESYQDANVWTLVVP